MKGLSIRALGLACWCWVAAAAIGNGTLDAEGVSPSVPAMQGADEMGAWTAYAYAAERAEAWGDYAAAVAEEAEDAAVLNSFGLIGLETAEALAEMRQQAEARRSEHEQLVDAAYAGIALHYAVQADGKSTNDGSSAGEGDNSGTVVPAAATVDLSVLREAVRLEEQANRAARAAALMRRSGTLDAVSHLAKQEAYLAARLRSADAREEAVQAMRSQRLEADGSGAAEGLRDWLHDLRLADDLSLEEEWMSALSRYASEPYEGEAITGNGTDSAGPAWPAGQAPGRLPLNAVALAGAPVKLSPSASPFLTEAGETYVPLRPYAEALRYRLDWDAKRSVLRLTRDADSIELRLGQPSALHNGQSVRLSEAPLALGGHAFVPLSLFADAAGCDVYWSETWRQGIIITRANGDVE